MAQRTDTFDLERLHLRSGEGRRFDLAVPIDRLQYGGTPYDVTPSPAEATLDVSRTTHSGYALRLRFDAQLHGPCMRCLEPAEPTLHVDVREVSVPGGGPGKDVIDGLMSSGDVGHFDEEGRLFIDGRDDDMIVSGGENVFPAEVEELLARHDAVEEVAVFGVDDEAMGQRLKAVVVTRRGTELEAEEVKDYVKSNLAGYKVPRDVEFIDELPRNATGKVLKRELREDGGNG